MHLSSLFKWHDLLFNFAITLLCNCFIFLKSSTLFPKKLSNFFKIDFLHHHKSYQKWSKKYVQSCMFQKHRWTYTLSSQRLWWILLMFMLMIMLEFSEVLLLCLKCFKYFVCIMLLKIKYTRFVDSLCLWCLTNLSSNYVNFQSTIFKAHMLLQSSRLYFHHIPNWFSHCHHPHM